MSSVATAVVAGSYIAGELFGPDAPPGADPAIGQSAQANAKVAADTLEFNKQVYAEGRPRQQMIDDLGKRVVESQIVSQDKSNALADDYAAYMKGTFRPVEKSLVDEASKDTGAEAEQAASEAGAGVSQQFGAARQNKAREMAAMGINPNSGRWNSATQGSMDTEAAVKADAMNKARVAGKGLSWAKRMDAAGLGRNLPSNQATSAGLALTAGNSAMANSAAGGINARADAGQMNQGFGGTVNANTAAGNLYLGQYDAQLKGYAAQQAADAAKWQGVGTAAGMMYAKSSKKLKTDKHPVEDAEILKEVKTLPVEKWKYKEGEGDGGEHVGPYAEDVAEKFGGKVAPGGKMIDVISMMGVTLAATKALAKQVDKIERKMNGRKS